MIIEPANYSRNLDLQAVLTRGTTPIQNFYPIHAIANHGDEGLSAFESLDDQQQQ